MAKKATPKPKMRVVTQAGEKYDTIPFHDGYLVGRPYSESGTLDELLDKREWIARIICHDFADQEVTSADDSADYTIELDGKLRRFQLFHGFRIDLRTPDYDTRKHREKRRRFIRLQTLCMAYTNAAIAVGCYETLQGECVNRSSVIEMLADSCLTFGQQWSQFVQWDAAFAKMSERGKANISSLNECYTGQHGKYQPAVESLMADGTSYTKATERVADVFNVSARTVQRNTENPRPRHGSRHRKKM
ncbi:hypothetical protein [Aeoliella mucimassa]|uniref:Uncharacterized protein n=1 Tax=Aeoliella mucimassa TaxID=2527972 RepID=A0A518AN64_9BACT|nr:hypothetical protein [Aeoliella mucimassa]QDU56164.1 hypothetical protein Pan181_23680 [Aeoliella mucimassa]